MIKLYRQIHNQIVIDDKISLINLGVQSFMLIFIFVSPQIIMLIYDNFHSYDKMNNKLDIDRTRSFRICTQEQYQQYWCELKNKQKRSQKGHQHIEIGNLDRQNVRNKNSNRSMEKNTDESTKIPKFTKIQTEISKRENGIPENYIHFNFPYPCPQQYELTKADLCFFFSINANLQSIQITQCFFKEELIELQKQFGRSDITKKNVQEERILFFTKMKQRRPNFGEYNLFKIGDLMFNYWLQRRKQFHYPFYRPLWRAQPYQLDHYASFRRRDKETRILRKTSRPVDFSTVNDLYQQFCLAAQICSKICKRQNVKFKKINSLIFNFNHECQQFQPTSVCLKEADRLYLQEIQQCWSRQMKEYEADCKAKEAARVGEEVDCELSISNFLSSVVSEADKQGLTYDLVSQFQHLQLREQEHLGHTKYQESYYVDLPQSPKPQRPKLSDLFNRLFNSK